MSKNKPKTIADLKFKWTFDSSLIDYRDVRDKFDELNDSLSRYRIKSGCYTFVLNDESFKVDCFGDTLVWFFDDIHFAIIHDLGLSGLILDHFELISENTFRIHVKK